MKKKIILFVLLSFTVVASAQETSSGTSSQEAVNQRSVDMSKAKKEVPVSGCNSLYREIESEVEKSNYCGQDSDCTVLELGGMFVKFGCYHFINKEVN